jgi:hypothetical protein
MHGHRTAELTSLALHREVARRLRADPSRVALAREWLRTRGNPSSCARWAELLAGPLEALCALLEADTEEARELRQSTPFAGVLDAPTRLRIWWSVRE